jgi:hypothetical protein
MHSWVMQTETEVREAKKWPKCGLESILDPWSWTICDYQISMTGTLLQLHCAVAAGWQTSRCSAHPSVSS